MKTGTCNDPSLYFQVYIVIVTLCSHFKRYLSPVSNRFFLNSCKNLNKDLQHNYEGKSHKDEIVDHKAPKCETARSTDRASTELTESTFSQRSFWMSNNRDLFMDIFFMWALTISLFVFPKHGAEVQMSNLTFEELIKDGECPADTKMKASMEVSLSTCLKVP